MKSLIICGALLLSLSASAQSKDERLIADAEYKMVLNQIAAKLPVWEKLTKGIDPSADAHISFAVGQLIVFRRGVALQEIQQIRTTVEKERIKRKTSRELSLHASLTELYDTWDWIAAVAPTINMPVEGEAPVLGPIVGKIANDVYARVEKLETNSCP